MKSFLQKIQSLLAAQPKGAAAPPAHPEKVHKDLMEARTLFETVFNNSAAAITVADKDERIVAWNPFTEALLGMTNFDLFNKPLQDLYPQAEWTRMEDLRIKQKGLPTEVETQVLRKDGSLLDVSVSISFIKDADGQIVGSIGIMLDITRQKNAERMIRESETKIRVILDNSAVAITMTDEQDRVISWNKYTEQMLQMTKEDLYQRPSRDLYPPEEWVKIESAEIPKSGSRHHLETRIIRKDGNILDVDLSVNVLKDLNDKVIGSVAILQDITEQKKVQQMLLTAKIAAEEASSAKSLFLANMSHEVRTPMSTILGLVDLTLDGELHQEQRDNLTTIKEAAKVLLSLLNDILDLSRVEAGKIELEQIELNIHNIVKSVCHGLTVLANNKNLQLVWDISPDVPETLVGDPVRIRQVLVNLINNAIKFTFKGKITTTVKVHSTADGCYELLFSVEDEGVGIPPDKIDTIFEVFTQADASTTRKFGGTGLGLSISKKLVEMMNGRIWVTSEELKGSKFSFTACFSRAQAAAAPAAESSASLPADAGLREIPVLSILLAEDNIVNQKIAVRMLEKRGWKVKAVENGQQVLDAMEKESFDAILMDAQMPVMDGYEATRQVREREKSTGKHIPIIALTARAMSDDRAKCLASGMDGYVAKPIEREKLFEAIEQLCR